jgi:hypothetical protein
LRSATSDYLREHTQLPRMLVMFFCTGCQKVFRMLAS